MRILVTGASGFLGTTLCAFLQKQGATRTRLNSRNCDLTRAASLPAAAPERYDLIFHLAAWTQAGDFCLEHPGEQWLINQKINTHVLDFWAVHQQQAKLV